MKFDYNIKGSVDLDEHDLEDIAANYYNNGTDIQKAIDDVLDIKYGYDDDIHYYVEYIADNVKKYIEDRHEIFERKNIKWLRDIIINNSNSISRRYINNDDYEIKYSYNHNQYYTDNIAIDDNTCVIKINIKKDGKIQTKVEIYIEQSSNSDQLEIKIVVDNNFYMTDAKLYDKIHSIPVLNIYEDILESLNNKDN